MSNTTYAFITGSSRGIGEAIAIKLASEGYFVFLNCRHSSSKSLPVEQHIRRLFQEDDSHPSHHCLTLYGDVGDPNSVRQMFTEIRQITDGAGLDILVNNAGIAHIGLLSDTTDIQWEQLQRTNLWAPFYCCRAALPAMVHKKQGRILNISSMWGQSGASCEAAYSASKAGVDGLTKALAKELAPSGIQVNALSLGVIDTSMNQQLSPEEREALAQDIPVGRFGSPEEVAQTAWHLLHTPTYLTGQIIRMDGGYI